MQYQVADKLAHWTWREYFTRRELDQSDGVARLLMPIQEWLEAADAKTQALMKALRHVSRAREPDFPNAERLLAPVWTMLAERGINRFAANAGKAAPQESIRDALQAGVNDEIRPAAVRALAGMTDTNDEDQLSAWLETVLPGKETIVNQDIIFFFEKRRLPQNFDTDAYETSVRQRLKAMRSAIVKDGTTSGNGSHPGIDVADPPIYAAVVGMMLLDEEFDPTSESFRTHVVSVLSELTNPVKLYGGDPVSVADVYAGSQAAAASASTLATRAAAAPFEIAGLPDRLFALSGKSPIAYQELAAVGRFIVANADEVPWNHPNTESQIRRATDDYVAGGGSAGTLDLPQLSGSAAVSAVEIYKRNIIAGRNVFFTLQLEKLKLFTVVERIVEAYQQGLLPILGSDTSGRSIDTYLYDDARVRRRLAEARRYSLYTRVLGASGGEITREIVPNKDFDNLFMRFLASIYEYSRQQSISDLFQGVPGAVRSGSITGETVRKAGRDLAACMSLYGWGDTETQGENLIRMVNEAVDILSQPGIQRAYGADSVWQLVERVCVREFGQSPNIVKFRTMAEAGGALLNLVARYSDKWSVVAVNPLFPVDNGNTVVDIPDPDYSEFVRHVEAIRAVNGIPLAALDQASQPAETTLAPTLPPMSGNGSGPSGQSGPNMDQIKQMIQGGQMPSMNQLKEMVGMN